MQISSLRITQLESQADGTPQQKGLEIIFLKEKAFQPVNLILRVKISLKKLHQKPKHLWSTKDRQNGILKKVFSLTENTSPVDAQTKERLVAEGVMDDFDTSSKEAWRSVLLLDEGDAGFKAQDLTRFRAEIQYGEPTDRKVGSCLKFRIKNFKNMRSNTVNSDSDARVT